MNKPGIRYYPANSKNGRKIASAGAPIHGGNDFTPEQAAWNAAVEQKKQDKLRAKLTEVVKRIGNAVKAPEWPCEDEECPQHGTPHVCTTLPQEEFIRQVLERGGDPHTAWAARCHGKEEKDVTPAERQAAKKANFWLLYDPKFMATINYGAQNENH